MFLPRTGTPFGTARTDATAEGRPVSSRRQGMRDCYLESLYTRRNLDTLLGSAPLATQGGRALIDTASPINTVRL